MLAALQLPALESDVALQARLARQCLARSPGADLVDNVQRGPDYQYIANSAEQLLYPREQESEEGDDENEMMTIETEKGSQSSKKKWEEPEEGEQASLFEAPAEQQNQNQPLVNGQPPKPKAPKPKEPEQANLFGEKRKSESAIEKKSSEGKKEKSKVKKDEEGFSPGQTIELEL